MRANESSANRERRQRIVAEHRATLEREKREGKSKSIREKIKDELQAHWLREKELLEKLSPPERRSRMSANIRRVLGAAGWIALVTLGPQVIENMILAAAMRPVKEVVDTEGQQARRVDEYRREGKEEEYVPATISVEGSVITVRAEEPEDK